MMEAKITRIDEKTINIFVPIKIKRRGGSAMVILPKGVPQNNYDQKLISAFAKAYKWQQMLKKDKSMTMKALSEKENVAISYFRKIMRLNYIAPDIVATILDGKQARDLKLQDFMSKTIPNLWQEQREVYGFAH